MVPPSSSPSMSCSTSMHFVSDSLRSMVACDVVFSFLASFSLVTASFSFVETSFCCATVFLSLTFSLAEAFCASFLFSIVVIIVVCVSSPSTTLLVLAPTSEEVIQSLGHLQTALKISSLETKYGNLFHVPLASLFNWMCRLWKSDLKYVALRYFSCKLGDKLGHWLITILSTNLNKTQNILVSITRVQSLVAHREEKFTVSGRSKSC